MAEAISASEPVSARRVKRPRRIAVLLFHGVSVVDVAGPLDTFELVNFLSGKRHYDLVTASMDGAPVAVTGGFMTLQPTHAAADLPLPLDSLIVPGGPGIEAGLTNPALLRAIRLCAPHCDRVASVCTGALLVAASGATGDAPVTMATHWKMASALGSMAGTVTVDTDAIFSVSGRFWSSAGMTAGIDMALAMIEADHGHRMALDVARFLVLALRRDGGQSQFSPHLRSQSTADPRIRAVQAWIEADPQQDLRLPDLARRAAMSTRSLQRAFHAATGETVVGYIQTVRLDHGRRLLETTRLGIGEIAGRCGFASGDSFRLLLKRHLGVTPRQYRQRFGIAESLPEAG